MFSQTITFMAESVHYAINNATAQQGMDGSMVRNPTFSSNEMKIYAQSLAIIISSPATVSGRALVKC